MNEYETLVEWQFKGKQQFSDENLSYFYFVHNKSHMFSPGFEPGSVTDRPSNGTVYGLVFVMEAHCVFFEVGSEVLNVI
jgi:hypothetical protein